MVLACQLNFLRKKYSYFSNLSHDISIDVVLLKILVILVQHLYRIYEKDRFAQNVGRKVIRFYPYSLIHTVQPAALMTDYLQ